MKVSIILPFYNKNSVFDYVMNSLQRQTYVPDEIVVIDDGSRVSLLPKTRKYSNLNIKFIRIENPKYRNCSAAYNAGLRIATGDAVVLCAGELVHNPHNISLIRMWLKMYPKSLVIGSRVYFEGKNARIPKDVLLNPEKIESIKTVDFKPGDYPGDNVITRHSQMRSGIHATMIDFVKRVNGYNEDLDAWGHNDADFRRRCLNLGLEEIRMDDVFSIHCWHSRPPKHNMQKSTEQRLEAENIGKENYRCKNGLVRT